MRVVYIDELFVLNFAVDYIIIHLTAHFSALPFLRWRLLVAAAAGAAYATAAYFAPTLCSLPLKLAAGVGIVLCAFGSTALMRRTVIFYVASFLLGGLAYGAGIALGAPTALRALLVACALALGLGELFSRSGGGELSAPKATVELTYNGRRARFYALRDSGNLLRDPLDGSPIVVAEGDALSTLFDGPTLRVLKERSAVDAVAELGAGWRLVPCATAAGSALMAAFRPSSATVDGEMVRVTVALSPSPLGALPALVGDLRGATITGGASAYVEKAS